MKSNCTAERELLRETLQLASTAGVRRSWNWKTFCSEPVRLKNMVKPADQLDDWSKRARPLICFQLQMSRTNLCQTLKLALRRLHPQLQNELNRLHVNRK